MANRSYTIGRLKPGQMNKTEAAYAAELEQRKYAGEILWYAFEPWKFRLADKTFYTPDFGVLRADHQVECHEVKGFWQDDASGKDQGSSRTASVSIYRGQEAPEKGWRRVRTGGL